jgi:hypothetical protein
MFKFIKASKQKPDAIASVRVDDIRWRHRKIPSSHGRHIVGRYSPGPARPSVQFESYTECRAIAYLIALPGVHVVLSQPFTIDFHLRKLRGRYTPDLLVVAEPLPPELARLGFGVLTVLEIKAKIDPHSRALIEFKLQLSIRATGLPTFVAIPKGETAQNAGEVDHVA